jgi:hypothetical protein
MSRKQPDLTLDGLRLPLQAAGEIQQTYEQFGGFGTLRLGLGAIVHQEVWRKLRTTLSASGLIPPGLDAIDWTATHTLGCIAPRSIHEADNVITLPAARRTDAAPFGFAIDANGLLRPVSVALVGNVATLGTVAEAIGYQVLYYPLLTIRAPSGPRCSYDAAGAVAGWELACEEV